MSLLTMGQEHRGTRANIASFDPKKFRQRSHPMPYPDPWCVPYIERAGFGHVMHVVNATIDAKFILALCERWRPETHTFHLPTGECTVTLEDVYMLLGLRIDGKPVTGNVQQPNQICVQMLGVDLVEGEGSAKARGQGIKLSSLQLYHDSITLTEESSEQEKVIKTRFTLCYCLGTCYFPKGQEIA
ncbi:protein MAINTENANCE OF MERISTEMS-like [Lathyrus oleraceus]|uniref:protein MAINTENANCE OF MERISTEMS-like n=1 Tax=Pisum sativum TaxID=3888 RepID=UPI0021D05AF0|nr:protein MAINTENANCE OF MERISTEMS-like [Pisum sativum]